MIAKGYGSALPLAFIKTKVSEFDILAYYLGVTSIPTVISSPIREDYRPSLGIYTVDNDRVWIKDFATGLSTNLFGLLMLLWNTSFDGVLARITKDLSSIIKGQSDLQITKSTSTRTRFSNSTLQVKIREWKDYDLNYWNSYGISLPWLKFGNIHPISHVFITKDNQEYIIPTDKFAYVYIENKDEISLKVYQPFSILNKWYSKHDHSVWDLWNQLPETGDNLIITSSRKDALSIWENTGIPSCSLQAESYWPKPQVVTQLKERFKTIFVLYDNDFNKEVNHGRLYGTAIAKQFDLIQIEIPEKLEVKDSSDLCKKYGREVLQQTILKLIQYESYRLWNP